MPKAFKWIIQKSLPLVDLIVGLFALIASPFLKLFTRIGAGRMPISRELFKTIGLYPISDHYYQPLFNDKALKNKLSAVRELPGIDLSLENQIDLCKTLTYSSELAALGWSEQPKENKGFHFSNGNFEAGDADFLYQFVRKTKPARVIEIGSGSSTKIVAEALFKNRELDKKPSKHIAIEPYENNWLETLPVEVIRKPVESCPIELFKDLKEGDLLFIDSSHMIRPQGDVLFEYLNIIPSLNSGVYVHVHDIFTPRDYPENWVKKDVRFWNEQYLLESMLSNQNRYKPVAMLNHLKHTHPEVLASVCPYLKPMDEPGSFYFRVC